MDTNKQEYELKKCPGCGGEAKTIPEHRHNDKTIRGYSVVCPDPKCPIFVHTKLFATEQQAADCWNGMDCFKVKGLEQLKKEYETQDNRSTAFPIYVVVQELRAVGVFAEGHAPCGDESKVVYEHSCDSCEDWSEECEEKSPEHCKNDVRLGYMWFDVEFFLTIKGANEYMKANAHNHGKLRNYVKCFERRNFEMRQLLKDIGFKIN